MKKPTVGPNFTIDNALITIRYKSQCFITPVFNRKVQKYTLQCEFPLERFDVSLFNDYIAALLFIDIKGVMYVARIGTYIAALTPQAVSLDILLANIQTKEAWDLEHLTPSAFYNDILSNKKFFARSGKALDSMVSPLGLSRKYRETDQAFRRRVIEYLQFKMGNTMTDVELKNLTSGKEIDEGGTDDI